MGNLGGHLLPGSFFILFALWWSLITALRFAQSRFNNSLSRNKRLNGNKVTNSYHSTVAMPCICLPCGPSSRRAPIESWLKAILGFIALLIEAYTAIHFNLVEIKKSDPSEMGDDHHGGMDHESMADSHSHSDSLLLPDTVVYHTFSFGKTNTQHITMYSGFVLGAVVEIMLHYGYDLPHKLDFTLGIVAFAIEAFLFAYHLHGREPVEVYLHIFLVYAIFGCVIFCCLEAYNDKEILFTYGRIAFTLLQGTWFYQVGFMLYPPTDNPAWHWDLNDHGTIMIITVCFCWHIMLIVIGLLVQLLCVKAIYERFSDNFRSQVDELIYIQNKENRSTINNVRRDCAQSVVNSNRLKFAMDSEDDDTNLIK